MANFGPTGYAFELDSYASATNTIGALQALARIVEFNGVNPEGVMVDLTALGDKIMNEGPTGLKRFSRIILKGFLDTDAAGAFKRIGRPADRTDYPTRTFKATHQTGLSQEIEVRPARNDVITAKDNVTMFEAEFAIGARADADYSETGF